MSDPVILPAFTDIADDYDAVICDVWGVLHDGVTVHPGASEALGRFRARGGRVLLVSNAPRPSRLVVEQLTRMGVPDDVYDDALTSGDIARAWLAERPGLKVHLITAPMHAAMHEGLDLDIRGPAEADWVVCTTLEDDDNESPADYEDRLRELRDNDVRFLCANPDYVVERGGRLVYCPGSLADRYREMGGEVLDTGKPSSLIYTEAFARLDTLCGKLLDRSRILAIGDAARTDITGARDAHLDALLIAKGIHADELISDGALADDRLEAFVRDKGIAPRYAQTMLR